MRFIYALLIGFFSFSCFAFSDCGKGVPPADVNFCAIFKEIAICHCVATGMPRFLCKNMNNLYNAMILRYGSVENACSAQTDTSKQTCLDSWVCYRKGGKDSTNNLCSGTGQACR